MTYFNPVYFAVFFVSILICGSLILTKNFYFHRILRRKDTSAVQGMHSTPTPRTGGVALGAGILVGYFIVPEPVREIYLPFAISLLPIFVIGFAEDMGHQARPIWRLLTTALSSAVAVILLGDWITHVGLPGVDSLISHAPVGIIFTVVIASGVTHSFNLIDGLNGLCAGTGILAALGLATISHFSDLPVLATVCMILTIALVGFLIFNFPWGKIFLGDSGAYMLGHCLVWCAIVLMAWAPDVAPWAVFLVFFWPIADMLFAIYRRLKKRKPIGQPDRLHFHQLTLRMLELRFLGRNSRHLTNPLATLVSMPFIAAPVLTGILLWNRPNLAFLATLLFAGLYVASYSLGMLLARSGRSTKPDVNGSRHRTPEPVAGE